MRKLISSLITIASFTLAIGCGDSRHAGSKVSGTVTIDGKAIEGGSVYMESEDGKFNDAGPIGTGGAYTVNNAPLGKLKVSLLLPPPPPPAPPATPKGAPQPETPKDLPKSDKLSKESYDLISKIPAKYKEVSKSGLSLTVVSGTNPPYDISIKSSDR
jgi:hypothetical protein